MKQKSRGLWILLAVVTCILLFLLAEHLFAAQLHKGNLISSTEELSQRITEELTKGNDTFSCYVNGMSEDELVQINHNLDGFFGHVSAYTVLRSVNAEVQMVRFDLEVSDNYYAYQKVVNNKEIENNLNAELLAVKVRQIMEACPSEDVYEKVVFYHDYIVTHTKYGFLEGEEEQMSFTAAGALLKGTAVCNGYAEAMELLLLCSGIDTYMAVGTTEDGGHAWNIVNIGDKWYHVDTTWDDPVPDMGQSAIHVYLNVSDAVMEKTHTWNRDAYPECTDMEENYYYQEGKAFSSFNDFKGYVLSEMKQTNPIEVMVTDSDAIQYDCGFVVREGGADAVSWQSYEDGDYMVMLINAK